MAERRYQWSLPYRPAAFAVDAELSFELVLDIPDSLYREWRERNQGQHEPYTAAWWRWVVESVLEGEALFKRLFERLYEVFIERVEEPRLLRQVDLVEYLLAFVQQFPYKTDSESVGIEEYARFPVETLWDQAGDCECLSILFAALLYHSGVANVVFLNPPGHIAVGVANDVDGSLSVGTLVRYQETDYAYCEATCQGWRVGECPPQYLGAEITVWPLAPPQAPET